MPFRLMSLAITIFALLLPTSATAADDAPLAREPRIHEVLTRAPSAVTLAFGWEIDSAAARIYVLDKNGKNFTASAPQVESTNVSALLDFKLEPGTYTVYYRVNGRTGDIVGGAYQFAIQTANWTNVKQTMWSGTADEPTMFKGTDPNNPARAAKPRVTRSAKSPGLEVVTTDGKVDRGEVLTKKSSDGAWLPVGLAIGILIALTAVIVLVRRRVTPVEGRRIKR